jgi:DNA-binding transcriptional MerR regulator
LTLESIPGPIIAAIMGIASGELAKRAGVSADTLRHYERSGVLAKPARSANNYRVYPDEAIGRVLVIRRSLAFGFSLAELAVILRERDKGGAPCRKVRAIAALKLAATESRLVELTRLRDDLRVLLNDWDARLRNATPGTRSGLLESLPSLAPPHLPKETSHEHSPDASSRNSRGLSGHWSHEASEKRTPARRRSKR